MNISSNSTHSGSFYMAYVLPSLFLVPPIGWPANALVLKTLVGKPGIRSTSEIFTASQALMDLVFCTGLCAEVIINLVIERNTAICLVFNQFGGPLHLAFTCLDTYLGVLHPISFMKLKAPAYRTFICVGIWTITVVLVIVDIFRARVTFEIVLTMLSMDLVIMYFCLIRVLWTLNQPGPGGTKVHPVKRRAFKTVLSLFISINLHYCLPMVRYTMVMYSRPSYEFSPFTLISITLQSMSSCVKPVLFLVKANMRPLPLSCPCCRA